jgi:hypothetical protein
VHLTAEIWWKSERRQRLALALVAAECESRRRRDMSDRLRASSLAGFFLARRGGERRRATTLSVGLFHHPSFGAVGFDRALCETPQLGNFLFHGTNAAGVNAAYQNHADLSFTAWKWAG